MNIFLKKKIKYFNLVIYQFEKYTYLREKKYSKNKNYKYFFYKNGFFSVGFLTETTNYFFLTGKLIKKNIKGLNADNVTLISRIDNEKILFCIPLGINKIIF